MCSDMKLPLKNSYHCTSLLSIAHSLMFQNSGTVVATTAAMAVSPRSFL